MSQQTLATQPAIDQLIELLSHYHGVATQQQLLLGGLDAVGIHRFCEDGVLVQAKDGFRLAEELEGVFFDGLVLLQWAIPEGVVGGLTAVSYHDLTVALPGKPDVYVPERWRGIVPAAVEPVHLVRLPPALFEYGLITVYPDAPGTAPVRMYAPEVAIAQALSDPSLDREAQEECVPTYVHRFGFTKHLEEALNLYQVREIPTPYYAHGVPR